MLGRLTAIYSILNAKGTVRQKRSRPLRAQVVLDCPKMAVRIEGRPDARVPALFELAAQQLQVCRGFGVPQYLIRGTSPLEGKQPAKALDSQCFSRGRLNLAAQQLQRL